MRRILAVVFAAIAVCLVHGSPAAQSYVQVTGCEPVTVGLETLGRIHFTVHNLAQASPVREIVMDQAPHGVSSDLCEALLVSAPPGWSTVNAVVGQVRWSSGDPATDIMPGAALDGFRIALSRSVCCHSFAFYDGKQIQFASQKACFVCDQYTPTRASTWGQLKAIYR